MKTKFIFKMQLAKQLQQMGNFIIKTVPNYKKPGFVVYVFENTEKLNKDLSLIQNKKNASLSGNHQLITM